MVTRVSHHVGQRIFDHIQNLAVQFGILTGHHQINLFAKFHAQVTDNPWQFRPCVANGLHAGFHHTFLQVRHNMVQTLQRGNKPAVFFIAGDLQQLVTGQNKFGHHGHQVF